MTTQRPSPSARRSSVLLCALLVAFVSTGCGDSAPPPRELPSDLRGAPLMKAPVAEPAPGEVEVADASGGGPATEPGAAAAKDPDPLDPATSEPEPPVDPAEAFMEGGKPAVSIEGGGDAAPIELPTLPEKPAKPDAGSETAGGPAGGDIAIGDVSEHIDPEPTAEDGIPFLSFDELASFRYIPEGLEEYGTIGHENPEHSGGAQPAEGSDAPAIPPPAGAETPSKDDKTADDEKPADKKPKNEIPEAIKKFDGKTVSVEGYMIPIEFDDGLVTEFILSRFIMGCCFGVVPAPNELVDVVMVSDEGAEYEAFLPVIVTGKLTVRGGDDKPGYMQGLYKLDGTTVRIAEPK